MTTPMVRPKSDTLNVQNPLEEKEEQEKLQLEEDIRLGKREPHSGMLYGLDTRKTEGQQPLPPSNRNNTSTSSSTRTEAPKRPQVGDGGASWKAKMLKRAKERAQETGTSLHETVGERFGSVSQLHLDSRGAASSYAHKDNQHNRLPSAKGDDMKTTKKVLPIGRDAGDKLVLTKFAQKLQDAMQEKVGGSMKANKRNTSKREKSNDVAEGGIDYSQLPGFYSSDEEKKKLPSSKVRKLNHHEDSRSSSKNYDYRNRSQHRPRRHESHKDREYSTDKKRSATVDEFGRSTDIQAEKRKEEKREAEREKEKRQQLREQEFKLEQEKRKSFLYGGASDTSKREDSKPREDKDRKIIETPVVAPVINPPVASAEVEVDLNKLTAQMLRAQMMGNQELYQQLSQRIAKLQENEQETVEIVQPPMTAIGRANKVQLEKEDLQTGFKRGKRKASSKDGDDDTRHMTLEELIRQERMTEDMDSIQANNIMRLGTRYQGSELSASSGGRAQHSSSGFDEEAPMDMKLYQSAAEKFTSRRLAQHQHEKSIGEVRKWDHQTQKCHQCMDSPNFKKHLLLALGNFTILSLPSKPTLGEYHHVILSPIEHLPSWNQVDENVWAELAQFKQSLFSMFRSLGQGVIFVERTYESSKRRHAFMEAIGVPRDLEADTPLYFKQALNESAEEWSTHHKIIDTYEKGLRRSIPKVSN